MTQEWAANEKVVSMASVLWLCIVSEWWLRRGFD